MEKKELRALRDANSNPVSLSNCAVLIILFSSKTRYVPRVAKALVVPQGIGKVTLIATSPTGDALLCPDICKLKAK